jgi:hypothetical protein
MSYTKQNTPLSSMNYNEEFIFSCDLTSNHIILHLTLWCSLYSQPVFNLGLGLGYGQYPGGAFLQL